MSHTLHVIASPRAEASASREITDAVVSALAEHDPATSVDALDLWNDPIPAFDAVRVDTKMTVIGGGTPTGAARDAWESIRQIFARFDAADTYVFGVPMWTSGIPWVLKQYIDTITQPGLAFAFDADRGYQGSSAANGPSSPTPAPSTPPACHPASAATSTPPTSRTGCASSASRTSTPCASNPPTPPRPATPNAGPQCSTRPADSPASSRLPPYLAQPRERRFAAASSMISRWIEVAGGCSTGPCGATHSS